MQVLAWFAQGVLFDPRRPPEDAVHTVGALPCYHSWHAYLRAMMFLDISRDRCDHAGVLPGVGYNLNLERPGEFNRLVLAVLGEHAGEGE